MEISYEGDASYRYMRISAEYEYGSHYAMRMLMENRIDGLLKMQMQVIDNEMAFCYDITEYHNVKEYCEDKDAGFSLVDSVYTQIIDMVERGREYLLPDTHYLISPDTVFIKENGDGWWKVGAGYHIGQQAGLGCQILAFTEFMMEHVNHKDKKAVQMVYGIYGMLREQGCSLNRIKEYMGTCREVSAEVSQVHILPKELQISQTSDSEMEQGFVRDLEKIHAINKWNATITVASALGMVAVIAVLAFYGNMSFRSLLIAALIAIAVEFVICGLVLKG